MRLVVGITISLICSPLSAQWLNYPTAGIPRLQDGKPNLTAPAPRTADGKPDLSGIWGLACPVANAVNGTITGANVYCATEVSVPAEFFNFGNSIKDGLPYQPWAAEVVRKTRAAGRLPMWNELSSLLPRLDIRRRDARAEVGMGSSAQARPPPRLPAR